MFEARTQRVLGDRWLGFMCIAGVMYIESAFKWNLPIPGQCSTLEQIAEFKIILKCVQIMFLFNLNRLGRFYCKWRIGEKHTLFTSLFTFDSELIHSECLGGAKRSRHANAPLAFVA